MANPATSHLVVSLVLGEASHNVTCSNLNEAKEFLERGTESGSSFGELRYQDDEQSTERPTELLFVAKLVDGTIHLDEVKLGDRRHFVLQEEDGTLSIVAE